MVYRIDNAGLTPIWAPLAMVLRGSLAQNRTRTVLAVIAIALGVALGYAVQLINAAAVNELAQGVQTLSGDADLEIRGPRGGFAEAIYPAIARMTEVAVASPVVEVDAKIEGGDAPLRIVGLDVFRAGYHPARIDPHRGRSSRHAAPGGAVRESRGRALARRCDGRHRSRAGRARRRRVARGGRTRSGRQSALRGDGHRGRAGRVRSARAC